MPRLGELLVQAGAVTVEQVDAALRSQKKHGGRLGAHLVEMGFVSESALARTLSTQLRVPAVSAAALEKIPRDVVGMLPRDTAAHHRAVPVRTDGPSLWVAMSDATDTRAIGEIEAITRRPVLPMVAADVLIDFALERHYGVPRNRRAAESRSSVRLDLRLDAGKLPPIARTPVGPPTPYADPYTPAERAAIEARVQSLDEVRPGAGRFGPSQLGLRLITAQSQRDVFEAALAFLVQDFRRMAILVLRNGRLAGFLADGKGTDQRALHDFSTAPSEIAVIAKVLRDGRPRLGRASAKTLGGLAAVVGPPGERAVLVLPLRCAGESVGVAVAVDGREGVEAYVDEYAAVGGKLDIALQILVLRKRLMEA